MNSNSTNKPETATRTILKAWLTAGTLDISAAFLHYYIKTGKNPVGILKYISGGIFGLKALTGGAVMALTGLLIHYLIALGWTLLFFIAYPQIYRWIKSTIVAGFAYGIFIWIIMNQVVLPLSALPTPVLSVSKAAIAMAILIFAIGIPVSIIIGKYYREKK